MNKQGYTTNNAMKITLIIVLIALTVVACNTKSDKNDQNPGIEINTDTIYEVTASVQTAPVQDDDDAADDPAVCVNFVDPSKSLIIGTNKQRGLLVYDLEGNELFAFDCGRVNNVDVRQKFPLATELVDIAGASNRTDNSITLVRIMPSGELIDISAGILQSELNEVYGFCLYHDQKTDKFYAIINGKDGGVEQWLLFDDGNGKIDGSVVRTFNVGSQPEGCVADDELGILYIGEENTGIWKYKASPDAGDERVMVDSVGSKYLEADIEGLTIYYGPAGKGYLIASSQGNNSFAVYERSIENKFLGSFVIVDGDIDGVQETDGIDVCSVPLEPHFPNGFFIAQDGLNKAGNVYMNQNFKLVPWDRIATVFKPELIY
jgi:3-phytase